MHKKAYCGNCANKWCGHNGTCQLCSCHDFYPRTYIRTHKSEEVHEIGWYDDRTHNCNVEIYKYD